MNHQRLTNQFQRSANMSYKRRNLEMTRTIQAQHAHQSNFMRNQLQMKMQNPALTKKHNESLSHSINKLSKNSSQTQSHYRFMNSAY